MSLQHMILVPPELWEKRQIPPPQQLPFKKIFHSKDHNYNKWNQVRLHQDPYLRNEKQKGETIAIPFVETPGTETNLNGNV